MSYTPTEVNSLIINKLTQAQYDAIAAADKSETELYLVPDEIDDVPTDGSDNPVKSDGIFDALAGKENKLYIGTATNWGPGATTCYLSTSYFLNNSAIPQKAGDLVFSRGTGCLHRCGAITYDSQSGKYKTNVTHLATVLVAHQSLSGLQTTANLVTSISSSSTDAQYPSAACVYSLIGDIETLLAAL